MKTVVVNENCGFSALIRVSCMVGLFCRTMWFASLACFIHRRQNLSYFDSLIDVDNRIIGLSFKIPSCVEKLLKTV